MGSDLRQRVQATATEQGQVVDRPAKSMEQLVRDMESQFALAMPRGAEAAQLVRDAVTSLRRTPKLAECEHTSVLGGLMTLAQLGLRPGVLGHGWLIPFYNGRERRMEAQLVIGYQGYVELAFRHPNVAAIQARTVREHDLFEVDYGIKNDLVHRPKMDGDRGEPIAYYAFVKMANGGYAFFVMSHHEVEDWRDRFAMAKTKEGRIVGPWRDHFESMALKTTVRQLAKFMPKSTALASAIEADSSVRVDLSPDTPPELASRRLEEGEPATDEDVASTPEPLTPEQDAAWLAGGGS